MMAPVGEALRSVVTTMAENMTETLYSMHLADSGIKCQKDSITTYFGDKLLLLHNEGCESIIGFKASLGQFIKIAKKNNSNSDDELEKLVRKICSEVRATPGPGDYNISYYARHKVIDSTSATLLKLVSSLVPGGAITTKPSLTLAQCSQQHICGAGRNQTTLGLAVKLHHKHGSSEFIKTLIEHGITSTYDEVLRFRKSVAKFVLDNILQITTRNSA